MKVEETPVHNLLLKCFSLGCVLCILLLSVFDIRYLGPVPTVVLLMAPVVLMGAHRAYFLRDTPSGKSARLRFVLAIILFVTIMLALMIKRP